MKVKLRIIINNGGSWPLLLQSPSWEGAALESCCPFPWSWGGGHLRGHRSACPHGWRVSDAQLCVGVSGGVAQELNFCQTGGGGSAVMGRLEHRLEEGLESGQVGGSGLTWLRGRGGGWGCSVEAPQPPPARPPGSARCGRPSGGCWSRRGKPGTRRGGGRRVIPPKGRRGQRQKAGVRPGPVSAAPRACPEGRRSAGACPPPPPGALPDCGPPWGAFGPKALAGALPGAVSSAPPPARAGRAGQAPWGRVGGKAMPVNTGGRRGLGGQRRWGRPRQQPRAK